MKQLHCNVLILLVLVFTTAWAGPRAETLWGIPNPLPERSQPRCGVRGSLDEDSLHRYDGIAYRTEFYVRPDSQTIAAQVILQLTTEEAELGELDFRFTQSLSLDSVWIEERDSLVYEWVGDDSLRIFLGEPMHIGDTISVGFRYHGTPEVIDAWGGFRFATAAGYRPLIGFSNGDGLNLDPPPANYNWLPTWADPTDKVTWDCWISGVHRQHTGGHLRTLIIGDDDYTNRHFVLEQPVSTYLLFIASSDYHELLQRDSLPRISHYVYPTRETQAVTHFANVPAVLDGFVNLFGPYPFEDFGFMMTRQGDMEHATCVSHLDQLVVANNSYDWLLFHELSHMWWGDWVTLGDWRDLWLNEGFATYCEALGHEILGGHDAYITYVENEIMRPARSATDSYSIYDPDYYWGATVYQKGASVLHMLRNIMGDSLFFQALRDYGQEHAYGNAVTADFQATCEEVYGEDLNWFFEPWVYGTRYPRYRVTTWIDFDVPMLSIEQIQTTETLFRMPIDLVLSDEFDTIRTTVWVEANRERQDWQLLGGEIGPIWPSHTVIDPNNKVLKTVEYIYLSADEPNIALPDEFSVSGIYPNPFNPSATISYNLPTTAGVALDVFDVLGRHVEHHAIGEQVAGKHQAAWDGSNFSSGIYFFTISTSHSAGTVKAVLLK